MRILRRMVEMRDACAQVLNRADPSIEAQKFLDFTKDIKVLSVKTLPPLGLAFTGAIISFWNEAFWVYLLQALGLAWLIWSARPLVRFFLLWKPAVILWLRRFDQGQPSRNLQRFLEGAVGGWGLLVTLADTDVRKPFFSSLFIRLLALVGLPIWAVAMRYSMLPRKVHSTELLLFYGCIAIAVGIGYVSFNYWRRKLLLTTNIDKITDVEKVERRLRAAQYDRIHFGGFSSVFRCRRDVDEIWRAVITRLAPVCDLVVVGGTSSTENLEWELRTVLSVCAVQKLLIMIPEGTAPEATMSPLIKATLREFAGPFPRVLMYPVHLPVIGLRARQMTASQRIVALAIVEGRKADAASRAHGVS